MAMPSNTRAVWIIVGAALTLFTVVTVAVGVWSAIRVPRDYDFSYPGSYGASLVSERSQETTTTVYAITTPVVIVEAIGPVTVRVKRGEPDRLTIRRDLAWGPRGREFGQHWEDGKVLRILLTCLGPRACSADYTLTVPADVKVLIAGPRSTRECPLAAAETVCRAAP